MLPKLSTKIEDAKTLTLTQLRAQIVPTKRDALIAINGSDKITGTPVCTYRKDGQIESQSETVRDVETGALISTKTIAWTYYDKEPGAPVDEITIVEMDAEGKKIKSKKIKHYLDSRQPEATDDDKL